MSDGITLLGAEGSPYSRKLRALVRYRRIPYTWVHVGSPEAREIPQPRVPLLPTVLMPPTAPDEDAHARLRTDTTPILRELETRFDGRAVVPRDPALAFLDALLEDYADEWLTKAMFHYRWAFPADIENAARMLPRWSSPDTPDEKLVEAGRAFARRQVERLAVVGSNEETAPLIEASYLRLLERLDAHLCAHRFVFGGRPSAADFALAGQLTQLARVDPTPRAIAESDAPRVVAWVDLMEDLSGREVVDDDWLASDALPATLRALLAEAGRTWAPFLLANARALESGAEQVRCEIDGRRWVQKPFPYQGKCLRWQREAYAGLAPAARERVDTALAGSGCEALFRSEMSA